MVPEVLEMLEVLQAIVGHSCCGGLHLHMHLVSPHDSLRLLPLRGGGRSVPMQQVLLRLQLRLRLHELLLCLHLVD